MSSLSFYVLYIVSVLFNAKKKKKRIFWIEYLGQRPAIIKQVVLHTVDEGKFSRYIRAGRNIWSLFVFFFQPARVGKPWLAKRS